MNLNSNKSQIDFSIRVVKLPQIFFRALNKYYNCFPRPDLKNNEGRKRSLFNEE